MNGNLVSSSLDWDQIMIDKNIVPANIPLLNKTHIDCPICNGEKKFRYSNYRGQGNWICSHCGYGKGLDLLSKVLNIPVREVIQSLESDYPSLPLREPSKCVIEDEFTPEKIAINNQKLTELIQSSVKFTMESIGFRYLQKRVPHIDFSKLVTSQLRSCMSLRISQTQENGKLKWFTFPGFIQIIRYMDGRPVTINRNLLTLNGDKAPIDQSKRLMAGLEKLDGPGIFVCKSNQSRILFVGEGYENLAAVATAFGYHFDVFSAINCYNLSKLKILRNLYDEVIIFGDHDKVNPKTGIRPGEYYAKLLQQRCLQNGFKCSLIFPIKVKEDWDDIWKRDCETYSPEESLTRMGLQSNNPKLFDRLIEIMKKK